MPVDGMAGQDGLLQARPVQGHGSRVLVAPDAQGVGSFFASDKHLRHLQRRAVREQIAARLYAPVQQKALVQYVRLLAAERGVEIPSVAAANSPLVQ
jgi:hypothetical protein